MSDTETHRLLHDLRNPLNSISINAELGKLTLERTGDIQRAIRIFEIILNECRNCSNKLDEVKTSSSKFGNE
ncbi:histidine kinase dimerization/phospho-acceptor domain-containing protein [Cellvibrio mixtus]|uniref:histidine kinase dimerization/phospho-acceptor domain-containing protein n=1 Tax=Cellvibrio mixtus TaxID=39650 RepID=UPI000587A0A0|nr:histidine kinase dimerization/phospho-acceptor domain-containing protein [Cellvibrio mixtus]